MAPQRFDTRWHRREGSALTALAHAFTHMDHGGQLHDAIWHGDEGNGLAGREHTGAARTGREGSTEERGRARGGSEGRWRVGSEGQVRAVSSPLP